MTPSYALTNQKKVYSENILLYILKDLLIAHIFYYPEAL